MKYLFFCAFFCIFLCSCSSTSPYKKDMKNWLSRHQDDLLISWGEPDFIINREYDKIYYYYDVEYYKTHGQINHKKAEDEFVRKRITGVNFPEGKKRRGFFYFDECITRFFIDQRRIIRKVTWRGNYCYPFFKEN